MDIDDARLLELMPKIVSFTRPLTHAGKHGESAVLARNVVDQLLDDDRLAYAGAAKQPNLAALQERLNQINDF